MPGRTAGAAGAGRVRIVPEMTTFRPRADGGGATRAATRDLRGESTTSRGVAEGNTSNLAIRARSHRSWEGSTDRRRRATRRPLSRRPPSTHRRAAASLDHAPASAEAPRGPLDRLLGRHSSGPRRSPSALHRRRDDPGPPPHERSPQEHADARPTRRCRPALHPLDVSLDRTIPPRGREPPARWTAHAAPVGRPAAAGAQASMAAPRCHSSPQQALEPRRLRQVGDGAADAGDASLLVPPGRWPSGPGRLPRSPGGRRGAGRTAGGPSR
jgi:hypothetical protein